MTEQDLSKRLKVLWRTAREQSWDRACRLMVVWHARDDASRKKLSSAVLVTTGWESAPPEDYEPEDNAAEFRAYRYFVHPAFTELEREVDWAVTTGTKFDAPVTGLGIGRA